jgi:hypothetical protein
MYDKDLWTVLAIVVIYPQQADDLLGVVHAAYVAVYEAKRAGRNLMHVWEKHLIRKLITSHC